MKNYVLLGLMVLGALLYVTACGGGGSGGGGSASTAGLVWDEGNWDDANWQ